MNDTEITTDPSATDPSTAAPAAGDSLVLTWEDVARDCPDLGGGVYLATVGADGRPHVAWVSIGYADECFWLSTFADSQKGVNLRASTEVAFHWPERPDRLAFGRGEVRVVTDRAESDQLWDAGVLPYDPGAFFTGKDDPRLLFVQIFPRRISFGSLFDPEAPPKVWKRG